jgi:hypothetical protein
MKGTILTLVGIAVALVTFFVVRSPQWRFFMAFRAPITFYGKVVDQHGTPVADAEVELRANDGTREGRPYRQKTDARGEFALKRSRGLTLFVSTKKDGYHRVYPEDGSRGSQGSFAYSEGVGDGIHVPDKSNPVIFVMHKAGPLEKLEGRERSAKLSRKGKPHRMTLHRDDRSRAHMVEVSCVTGDDIVGESRKFDWHFKITVIDGGLVLRKGDFAFEAPEDGYQPGDAFQMLASEPDRVWKDDVERSYFVRFNDGVHARINVRMIAHGDHFVVVKSNLNPKPGSRNLETPPKR